MLIRQEQSLQETSFPSSQSSIHQEALLEVLGVRFGRNLGSQNQSRRGPEGIWNLCYLNVAMSRCTCCFKRAGGGFQARPPPIYETSVGPRQNRNSGPIVDRGVQNSIPGFQGPPLLVNWHRGRDVQHASHRGARWRIYR